MYWERKRGGYVRRTRTLAAIRGPPSQTKTAKNKKSLIHDVKRLSDKEKGSPPLWQACTPLPHADRRKGERGSRRATQRGVKERGPQDYLELGKEEYTHLVRRAVPDNHAVGHPGSRVRENNLLSSEGGNTSLMQREGFR